MHRLARLTPVLVAAMLVAWGSVGADAQEPEASPPAAISRECQASGIDLSGTPSLPNVQRALKERRVVKIMTIGGSASALKRGMGDDSYALIEAAIEKAIANVDVQITGRDVSGELARDAADRMKSEVALLQPDLVLWQLGSSDAFAQVPANEFEATVEAEVLWLKEHGVDVALVGIQYVRNLHGDANYQAIRAAIRRIAERNNLMRIGRYEALQVVDQARKGALSPPSADAFATTETGYACLSQYVVKAITSGILSRPSAPARPKP